MVIIKGKLVHQDNTFENGWVKSRHQPIITLESAQTDERESYHMQHRIKILSEYDII